MTKFCRFKDLIIIVLLTVAAVLPASLFAQRSDNFFTVKEIDYEDRDGNVNMNGVIDNQVFGQDVPVGSGLLVMTAAGAGYALMRRKKHRGGMPNAKIMLIAFTMLLSLTQCKKNLETITPSTTNSTARIVLKVNNGGTKHVVNPNTGEVTFEPYMDYILVGCNGKYCGSLDYDGANFVGDLNPTRLVEGEYLYFYFISGLATNGLNPGDESWEVNISNQSNDLLALSCGRSNGKYRSDVNTYSCTMLNKCGLVNFHFLDNTPSSITMPDMLVSATIDFANNTIVPTPGAATGSIKLRGYGSNDKWAILLTNENPITTTLTVGDKKYVVDVPAINDNDYLTYDNGKAVIIGHEFSVSATEKVSFAPGNLQYKAGEGWRFAENQHDYVGSWNTSNWVDVFGWGTWDGVKDPFNIPYSNTAYDWSGDFSGTILNNVETGWYTPTSDDWNYILKTRENASAKYGSATVHGKHGIIILPDKMVLPDGYTFNSGVNGWDNNTPNDGQWSFMESYGAVFLPAAGFRDDTSSGSSMNIYDLGGYFGGYWSSSYLTNTTQYYYNNFAYDICFGSNQMLICVDQAYMGLAGGATNQRAIGQSVRLVR